MQVISHSFKYLKMPWKLVANSKTHYHTRMVLPHDMYQYLHKSPLPTMHFQDSLLRLPIPELNASCDKCMKSEEAIFNGEELERAKRLLEEFRTTVGPTLQKELLEYDKANKHTSYISKPWFDMYLTDRAPLVLNYNPFFAFQPEEDEFYGKPVVRATNLIVSSMRFMRSLREQVLSPEVYHLNPKTSNSTLFKLATKAMPQKFASFAAYPFKAFPLDMSQFENLFNSTRIPMRGKDRIKKSETARHMLMMKKGNFYVFDLFDENGDLYDADRIHACVNHVMQDDAPPPTHPIGILTTQNRDVWADARRMLWDNKNTEQLRLIDSAAFNLAFDDDVTVGLDPPKCFDTFLTGNGNNRWFDKSFSVIMTADGMASVNFEHAWGDGVAVMRYFNEIASEISTKSWIYQNSTPYIDATNLVRRLEFDVPAEVTSIIKNAQVDYESRRQSLNVDVCQSEVLGRKLCKRHGVSPDAMMQLGFQIAYHIQYGESVSTYESCSTAAFKHGRTETLRPATIETKALCDALIKPQDQWPSKSDLKQMVIKCSDVHANLTKEAAMGKGFDRHLFGLKHTAERLGVSIPAVYTDETYAKFNKFSLSTSTLPSPAISIGGFAPVVADGIGVGYRMQDSSLGLVGATYAGQKDGKGFIENVEKSYKLIADILSTT